MFEAIDARLQRLDAFKPFQPETLRRLDAVFEPWFIYGSNALEGNTLSLGDTFYIVREQKLPGGKREDEYLEVKGQQEAYAYLREVASRQSPLSERTIREFHQLLTKPLDAEKYRPGQYKDRDNQVRLPDGSLFPYVSHVDVPAAMRDLVSWFEGEGKSLHPIERAAGLHYRFILIHPFRDGNGRTARLLANLALLQAGHIMTIFRADERRRVYLDALHAVDLSVPIAELRPDNPGLNLFPFVSHLEQELLWSYDMALDILEGRMPTTTEDVVRRYETMEQRMLASLGIASNEQERLAASARVVEELTRRIGRSIETIGGMGRGWTELALEFGSLLLGARDILEGNPGLPSFANRRALLGLGGEAQGVAGLITIKLKRKPGSLVQLEVPQNICEFIVWAEPHALTVGCLRLPRSPIPADLKGTGSVGNATLRIPLDPKLWRLNEIDSFIAGQANRFLESMEQMMAQSSPPE